MARQTTKQTPKATTPTKKQQILETLMRAGFKGTGLRRAFAVVMAESSGNPEAHNTDASTGDNSYGLFQINMIGNMGPDRRARFGLKSNEDLLDPDVNARVAYEMSNGGRSWSAWTTYGGDTYNRFYNDRVVQRYARESEGKSATNPLMRGVGGRGSSIRTTAGTTGSREKVEDEVTVGGTAAKISTLGSEVATDVGTVYADGEVLGDEVVDLKSMTPEQRTKYRANKLAQYGFVEATLNLDAGRQYFDKDGRPIPKNKVVTLRSVFERAVREDWTTGRFDAAIRGTDWYKNTFDKKRLQQVLQTVDSATWEENVRKVMESIREQYQSFGSEAPDENTIRDLAVKSLYTELSAKDFLTGIANSINFAGETLKGQALKVADTIRKNARAFGINFRQNDTNFQSYVRQNISGEMSETDITNQFRQQAIKNYPALAQRLQAGATLRDIADPYLEAMSNILGVGEDDIDFDDPLMQQALNGTSPDQNPNTMSLWEFKRAIRKDPRWANTADAQQRINDSLQAVLADFGLVR